MPIFPPDMIGQVIANLAAASLIYYFMKQQVADLRADKAKLEAEVLQLRKQHEEDLQKQIRRRTGDTGRIPELPASEVAKFKKSIGEE